MRLAKLSALAALLALAAAPGPCDTELGGGGGGDAGTLGQPGTVALFELPRGAPISEFYALPFPNDLRRRADGTLDLDDHERPNNILEGWIPTFAAKSAGFGTNQAIFVRFSGEIDTASLPASVDDSLGDDASVYLVDVDPASPELGRKAPLRFRFQARRGYTIGASWLGALPYPGFPLRQKTTYALVVTSRLSAGGAPVGRSADFSALMGTGGDAAVTRARTVYAPLLAWLDGASSADDRDDVVAAAVFTTVDATSLMGKIRAVIRRPCATGQGFPACIPEPDAQEVTRRTGTSTYSTFEGTYPGPNFQSGTVPYSSTGGEILVDAGGDPIAQRMEDIRFAVTFPKTSMTEAVWPVVIYAHGTGGDYLSFVRDGTAGRMAAQGLAVISADQVLHGPRDPSGNNPETTFFNFLNPVAGRDNVRQGALDNFQMVRLVKRLRIVDGATTHSLDAGRISFMGHSQGGLTGPPFLAYEPEVKGAVLSGAGGLIYYALLMKTEPVNIPALIQTVIQDQPFDEFNNVLALAQMFIEPAEPVNYGPLLVRAPAPGVAPKQIFQSDGFVDTAAPNPGIEALGVAIGLAPVKPILKPVAGFGLRGLTALQAPVERNLNGVTGVFLQYNAPAGEDGHFVVFDVAAAQRQHASFLGTLAQTGVATLVP